ncbi:MAG: cyclase family protein [Deltaproteobacteria bacterium]|nr:cyclase family protein [Deltaproteobacteria bacterium]
MSCKHLQATNEHGVGSRGSGSWFLGPTIAVLLVMTNFSLAADDVTRPGQCIQNILRYFSLFGVKRNMGTGKLLNVQDLTIPIREGMLVFPGDPMPICRSKTVPFGNCNLSMSEIQLSVHSGTHVDAPAHFIAGAKTIEQLPTDIFVGQVVVIDLSHKTNVILRQDLDRAHISKGEKIFIKTRNSLSLHDPVYNSQHIYLDQEAARYLVDKNIRLLGFDYYNIDSSQVETLESHLVFARAGIPVIVAIDMSQLQAGTYHFSAVPLPLVGVEASPVRVVAWRDSP